MIKSREMTKKERAYKGAFFTPEMWVSKAHEYITSSFGENWQDEYYIWDCAAGTGNLLQGLTNKYNIYASTLDESDVKVMKESELNIAKNNIFQFDFLNDSFDKLPKTLKKIIKETPEKLIVLINPPYAEHGNGASVSEKKNNVSNKNKAHEKYSSLIGPASRELFTLFMTRIYKEIPNSKLCLFSKMKFINGSNFRKFKEMFKAEFLGGFICPANTFDNVNGSFPIGFTMWDLGIEKNIDIIQVDVFDKNEKWVGKKNFHGNLNININRYAEKFNCKEDIISILNKGRAEYQNAKLVYISNNQTTNYTNNINKENIIDSFIYMSVQHCIKANWINDRDQFLAPKDSYNTDIEFQNNCIAFSLFHGQNKIKSSEGVNHFIPFTESQVDSDEPFESRFMSDFIKDKQFSSEAKDVFNSGLELYKYYHSKENININASFYDIKEYFCGRTDSGVLKSKSKDEVYNALMNNLKNHMSILADKIADGTYEHGFLMR